MSRFSWLDQLESLNLTNLTIREQTRSADNPLNLRYRTLFPRVPTDSVVVSTIEKVQNRFTGGRRDWNAQGRELPDNLGPTSRFEMVPINPTKHMDERYLQRLGERGAQDLIRAGIMKDVSAWATELTDATERQLEVEAFEAWLTGLITVMDPKTGATVTVSLGYGTDEYPTPGTAWDDPAEDAYVNLLAGLQAATQKFGQNVGGVRAHRTIWSAIVADSPDGVGGLRPTFNALRDRVREEGFPDFDMIVEERTYDKWADGGTDTTTEYYLPDGLIAYQPADDRIGNTHVAPVVRAYDFLSGGNRSLANGVVIFRSEKNDGKTLLNEAQQNALVVPEQSRVFVEDTGIAR